MLRNYLLNNSIIILNHPYNCFATYDEFGPSKINSKLKLSSFDFQETLKSIPNLRDSHEGHHTRWIYVYIEVEMFRMRGVRLRIEAEKKGRPLI